MNRAVDVFWRCLCCALFFVGGETSFAADAISPVAATTLVPQTVYVGDRARLIVPLGKINSASARSSVVVDVAERLPKSKDIIITRVELERRDDGARALIDFIAYVPGIIDFPRIEVGDVALTGLNVTIASILETEGGAVEASPPAGPLAAPGTSILVYESLFGLIALAFIAIFFFKRCVPWFRDAWDRRRRSHAANSMRRVTKRLLSLVDETDGEELLSILFAELRSYLTYRTGTNYHSLTPGELSSIRTRSTSSGTSPVVGSDPVGGASFDPNATVLLDEESLVFLRDLFSRGDEIRFGGASVAAPELRTALEGVLSLIDRVETPSEAEEGSS